MRSSSPAPRHAVVARDALHAPVRAHVRRILLKLPRRKGSSAAEE
ncbi:hypothetical protein [Methylobacterium nigriterrae]